MSRTSRRRGKRSRGLRKFVRGNQNAGAGIFKDVGHLLRGKPNIHRHERAACHGHAIVHLQHDVAIGAERRDSIALLSPCASQQSREAMRPLSKLAIGKAALAVDDGRAL